MDRLNETIVLTKAESTRLVVLRKRAGLSRAQLAVQIGVSPDTVGRWERGTTNITAAARHALDKALPGVFA